MASQNPEKPLTEDAGEEHQETVRRLGLRDDTEDPDQSDGYQHSSKTPTCDIPSSKPINRGGDNQNDDQLNTISDAGHCEWIGDTCRLEEVCCVGVKLVSVN